MTSSAEWVAQFNTPLYPWPELPLPHFFNQLAPHSQEMLRRARCPDTKPLLSEWDRGTNAWKSGADIERKQRVLKEERARSAEPTANNRDVQNTTGENNDHDNDEDHDDRADEDMDIDHDDGHSATVITAPAVKRRKHLAPEERTFEVKRWSQVPFDVAEKTEERKFLADRRPGMPSLYGGTYQNQVFKHLGLSQSGYTAFGTSNASYDLGDGAGLGTAVTQEQPVAPPIRKNMPPKRKKKKGGPGRRKANPAPTDVAGPGASTANGITNGQEGTDVQQGMDASAQDPNEIAMQDADEEGSDSGDSEGEGSEEGEIEEGASDKKPEAAAPEPVSADPHVTQLTQNEPIPTEPVLIQDHEAIQPVEPVAASLSDEAPVLQPEPLQIEAAGVIVEPVEPGPMQEVMSGTLASEPIESLVSVEPIEPEVTVQPDTSKLDTIIEPDTAEPVSFQHHDDPAEPAVTIPDQAVLEPPIPEESTQEVHAVPISAVIDPVPSQPEPNVTIEEAAPAPVSTTVPVNDLLAASPDTAATPAKADQFPEASPSTIPQETELKAVSPPDEAKEPSPADEKPGAELPSGPEEHIDQNMTG